MNWLYALADDTTTWDQVWGAGGTAMYPLLLLAMAAIPVAAGLGVMHLDAGRKGRSRRFAVLMIAYGLLPIGVGALGFASGMVSTFSAVASVDPADKELILGMGRAEAAVPLRFGLFIGLPLVLAGTGMFLNWRAKSEGGGALSNPGG